MTTTPLPLTSLELPVAQFRQNNQAELEAIAG